MNLTTKRLWIKTLVAEDWHSVQAITTDFNNSDLCIYDMPLPVNDEDVKVLTQQWARSGLFFAVFLAETSKMIGYVCFHNDDGNYDLGYCFHSAHHGNGYALESCLAIMDELSRHNEVITFTASTALKNTPSCKLLYNLGFSLVGSEKLAFHKDAHGKDISFEGGIFVKRVTN